MSKKKLILIISIIIVIAVTILLTVFLNNKFKANKIKDLPLPEITGGARGELGIDKNINESNIDEYLNREDSVYRDMRMLEDPGNYEAIGGDRFLSGYIEGFEVIPLPYIIPVTGLPSEVGETYTGTTLFNNDNGTYVANFKESMSIIEEIFPKDKVIFLMCGGGGYAGMTKNFLVSLGWDENKIYNTGGYWFYKGEHSINVKKEIDGKVTYDFESVPYHNIDFESLTKNEDLITPDEQVSDLKINTTQLDLEVKNTFKLNVIVLPNEASNKELKWTSSNEEIAQVSNEGVVKALKEGEATIKATSVDGNKEVSCNVKVSKKDNGNLIELDDVSTEATELAQYDLTKISRDFYAIVDDKSGKTKPEYLGKDGKINDLWREEYNKYQANLADANTKRIEIFNKVVDAQKSFIVLIEDTECDSSYEVSKEAARILKEHNYSYIVVSMPAGAGNGDKTFFESRLDTTDYKGGAMAVVKEGKLYASTDPNTDSIKSEEDIINWLSKYIIIN